MDAVEFLKEWQRMCDVTSCENCKIGQYCERSNDKFLPYYISKFDEIVKGVEEWSKENPIKTRSEDFFEKFPNAPKVKNGTPRACAAACGYREYCTALNEYIDCDKCWNEPV